MRRATRRSAVCLLVGLALSACAPWPLPDRNSPEVRAEEARLVTVLENSDEVFLKPPGSCKVRLLGSDEAVSYVWGFCKKRGEGTLSAPMRVEAQTVTMPQDGEGFDDDVRAMFPRRLADAILEHEPRLQP